MTLPRFDPWGTHVPVLASCIARLPQLEPVLELGCGLYSTHLLHEMCTGVRTVVTMETNAEWLNQFRSMESPNHVFLQVKQWDEAVPRFPDLWGVVLIDHAPVERRVVDVPHFTQARFVVMHDSDCADYMYDRILPLFKYQYTYRRLVPWTTVVSNVDDLSFFER